VIESDFSCVRRKTSGELWSTNNTVLWADSLWADPPKWTFSEDIFRPLEGAAGSNFYAPQLHRQVLLRRVLAMAILSVRPSVRLSVTTRCRNNRVR